VLSEQLCGLLGGRYFLDPIGEVAFMINEFEDRILRFARLWVSQDREALAVTGRWPDTPRSCRLAANRP
jgi:hypothetical protein